MRGAQEFEGAIDDALDVVSLALDESCAAQVLVAVRNEYDDVLVAAARALPLRADKRALYSVAQCVAQRKRALAFLCDLDWCAASGALDQATEALRRVQQQAVVGASAPSHDTAMERAVRAGDAQSAAESVRTERVARAGARRSLVAHARSDSASLSVGVRYALAGALGLRLRRASAPCRRASVAACRLHRLTHAHAQHCALQLLRTHVAATSGAVPCDQSVSFGVLRLLDQVVASSRPFGLWRHGAAHVVCDKRRQVALLEARDTQYASAALMVREMCVDAKFAAALLVLESVVLFAHARADSVRLSMRSRIASVLQRLVLKWLAVAYERVYRHAALLMSAHTNDDSERLERAFADVVRRLPSVVDQRQRSPSTLVANFAVGLDKTLALTHMDDAASVVIDAAVHALRTEGEPMVRYGARLTALLSSLAHDAEAHERHFVALCDASRRLWSRSVPTIAHVGALLEHHAVQRMRAADERRRAAP